MKFARLLVGMAVISAAASAADTSTIESFIAKSPAFVRKWMVGNAYNNRWHYTAVKPDMVTIERPHTNLLSNLAQGTIFTRSVMMDRVTYTFAPEGEGTRITATTAVVLNSGTPEEQILETGTPALEKHVREQIAAVERIAARY